jgi:protein required for attachment to host cells
MDYRTSPHATEARRFARRVISVLRDGRDHHAYNSVAIAAPARFLGLLRSMLNPKERRHLRLHVPRDFTRVTGRSLEARVQKLLGQSG